MEILSRQFQYISRAALSWVYRKSTVAEQLNLAKFTSCLAQCHVNLEGYHFPYKYVRTLRSRRADLGDSYFDLILILTKILHVICTIYMFRTHARARARARAGRTVRNF